MNDGQMWQYISMQAQIGELGQMCETVEVRKECASTEGYFAKSFAPRFDPVK